MIQVGSRIVITHPYDLLDDVPDPTGHTGTVTGVLELGLLELAYADAVGGSFPNGATQLIMVDLDDPMGVEDWAFTDVEMELLAKDSEIHVGTRILVQNYKGEIDEYGNPNGHMGTVTRVFDTWSEMDTTAAVIFQVPDKVYFVSLDVRATGATRDAMADGWPLAPDEFVVLESQQELAA